MTKTPWKSASPDGELLNKILTEGNGKMMTPKQIRESFPVFQKYPSQRWSQIVRRARDKLGLDHLRGVKSKFSLFFVFYFTVKMELTNCFRIS